MQSQRKYALFGLFTLLVCSIAFYIYRHQEGKTGTLDRLLIGGQGYVQKHFFYFGFGARTLFDHYLWLVDTKKHNEELEKEMLYLRTKLAALQEVEIENGRLRNSLKFKDSIEFPLVSAHVVAHDIASDYFGIRIDRGSFDGIRTGMGVISPNGLVGRVHRVSAHYSDVVTLVDPTSNIDAVIQRSRVRGIVTGQSKQLTCKMRYVDRLDDVVVNDTVVSSGFLGIFPKGLLIGHVTAVIPSANAVLQTVMIQAAVDIYRLEEVFIVLSSSQSAATTR